MPKKFKSTAASLISMDPGLRDCSVARFTGGVLTDCAFVRNTELEARGPYAWVAMARAIHNWADSLVPDVTDFDFVSETMQVYKRGPANPDDLLQLQAVVGAVSYALRGAGTMRGWVPKDWKGTVPKAIHNKRVLVKLSPEERAVLDACDVPKSLLNNVIDAVGIGLFALGRGA